MAGNPSVDNLIPITGKLLDDFNQTVNVANFVTHSGFENIDHVHQSVHEGNVYTASHLFTSVADNGFAYMRVKPGTKPVHGSLTVSAGGKCYLTTYSGTTYSANGAEASTFNRNSLYPTANKTGIVYQNPTINVLGTVRFVDMIAGGNSQQTRVGGANNPQIESVYHDGDDILLAIQNKSGAVTDIACSFTWYETPA